VYPHMNEDVAWQHLQDLQREVENSRLMAQGQPVFTVEALRRLGARVVHLASATAWRAPRRLAPMRHDGE
jgi:hypothetical protein